MVLRTERIKKPSKTHFSGVEAVPNCLSFAKTIPYSFFAVVSCSVYPSVPPYMAYSTVYSIAGAKLAPCASKQSKANGYGKIHPYKRLLGSVSVYVGSRCRNCRGFLQCKHAHRVKVSYRENNLTADAEMSSGLRNDICFQ